MGCEGMHAQKMSCPLWQCSDCPGGQGFTGAGCWGCIAANAVWPAIYKFTAIMNAFTFSPLRENYYQSAEAGGTSVFSSIDKGCSSSRRPRSGPAIIVVASAMITIMAKREAGRMPRS